jgi:hypothetical protein
MIGYSRSLNISRVTIVHNGERWTLFCFPYSHYYYTAFFFVLKINQEWLGVFWRATFCHPCSARKEKKKNVNLHPLPLNSKRNENK